MISIDKYEGEIDFSGAYWDKDKFFEGGSEPIENRPNFDSDDYWSNNYKEKTYADKALFCVILNLINALQLFVRKKNWCGK